MNYIEALQALAEGKKIRHKSWDKGVYRFIGADDKFYNDINAQTSFMIHNKNEILSDSWELYQTEEDRLIADGKKWKIYRICRFTKCSTCEIEHPKMHKYCQNSARSVWTIINDYNITDDEVDKLYKALKGEIDA